MIVIKEEKKKNGRERRTKEVMKEGKTDKKIKRDIKNACLEFWIMDLVRVRNG